MVFFWTNFFSSSHGIFVDLPFWPWFLPFFSLELVTQIFNGFFPFQNLFGHEISWRSRLFLVRSQIHFFPDQFLTRFFQFFWNPIGSGGSGFASEGSKFDLFQDRFLNPTILQESFQIFLGWIRFHAQIWIHFHNDFIKNPIISDWLDHSIQNFFCFNCAVQTFFSDQALIFLQFQIMFWPIQNHAMLARTIHMTSIHLIWFQARFRLHLFPELSCSQWNTCLNYFWILLANGRSITKPLHLLVKN